MDKILEALKDLLKEGVTQDAVRAALAEPVKELNPLEGVAPESVGLLLSKSPALKSAFDKKVDETVKKWSETNFDKMYQERHAKEHPETDPAMQKVRELEAKYQDSEKARRRERLMLAAMTKAKELKLPDEVTVILDRLVGEDEETTFSNLSKLEFIPKAIQKGIEDVVKGKFRSEPPKGGTTFTSNPWKKETFNLTKQGELLKTDQATAERLMAEAKGA